MGLIRAYFRIIYIILGTVIIFAAAMLTVENDYIKEMAPIIEEKRKNGTKLTDYEMQLPKE